MGRTISEHIDVNPAICGGRPCIAGSRIRVQDIYTWHELEGVSPDEIVSDFLSFPWPMSMRGLPITGITARSSSDGSRRAGSDRRDAPRHPLQARAKTGCRE